MIEKLKELLDMEMNWCEHAKTGAEKRTYFDHAYGEVTMYMYLYPGKEEEVEIIWNEYRARFEILIYGE